MSDIVEAVRSLLSMTWHFLMHTFIPNTHIAYGVFLVGLAIIPIGFKFLSVAVGHNIGDLPPVSDSVGSDSSGGYRSYQLRIADGRQDDVR